MVGPVSTRARNALLVSVAATALIYLTPVAPILGWPLVLLSTLAHEGGHGLAALVVGGEFHSLQIFADASGVAMSAYSGRVASALVSAGGLVGPALVAAACFFVGRHAGRSKLALGAAGAGLLVFDLLFVRNLFGFAFVALLGAGLLAVARKGSLEVNRTTLLFLGVQLALSVFSRADYLFMESATTGAGTMPSDVAQMADALFLPYWFWGAACGLFSLLVLAQGLKPYLTPRAAR